jgi:hypothetical protein
VSQFDKRALFMSEIGDYLDAKFAVAITDLSLQALSDPKYLLERPHG